MEKERIQIRAAEGLVQHRDTEGTLWFCREEQPEPGWEGLGCLREESARFVPGREQTLERREV